MASTVQPTNTTLPGGVRPLAVGQGNSFFWRRLHSLTGIIPIGLFLLEHFISNAEALNGVSAYNSQVKFLTGLPFRLWLEILFIFLPLAFHGLYGFYIWWRGENNVVDYGWKGNWFYTLQRYSGIVLFFFVAFHLWTMRFTGLHLTVHSDAAFWKVQHELATPLLLGIYVVGLLTASWHFGYGLFLFAAKWGIVTGERAQKRAQAVGICLGILLMLAGLASVVAFKTKATQQRNPEWDQPAAAEQNLEVPSNSSSQAQ